MPYNRIGIGFFADLPEVYKYTDKDIKINKKPSPLKVMRV